MAHIGRGEGVELTTGLADAGDQGDLGHFRRELPSSSVEYLEGPPIGARAKWHIAAPPTSGTPVQLRHLQGRPVILSADGSLIGEPNIPLNPSRRGLLRATVGAEAGKIDLSYLGPDDLWLA